jgi:hypothetical protein
MHHSNEQYHRSNEEITDVDSTLEALSRQEESFYLVDDYFQNLPRHSSGEHLPVDADARQQIAKWSIKIIEALQCSNDIAEILMSCLDRFVSTKNGETILLDRSQYQLAALTALYSSVKIHNPTALSPEFVSKLSRGEYCKYDIEAMERRMLDAIQWRVNPPTAMDFVRIYLDMSLVWNWLDLRTQDIVLELVGYQINLSISEFDISTSKASHIAIASLLNATKSIHPKETYLYESIRDVTSFTSDIDEKTLENLQRKLYEGMVQENNVKINALNETICGRTVNMKSNSFTESPRSVYEYNRNTIV